MIDRHKNQKNLKGDIWVYDKPPEDYPVAPKSHSINPWKMYYCPYCHELVDKENGISSCHPKRKGNEQMTEWRYSCSECRKLGKG